MNYVLDEQEYKALKGQSEELVDRYDRAFYKEMEGFLGAVLDGRIQSAEECKKRLQRAREAGLKAANQ